MSRFRVAFRLGAITRFVTHRRGRVMNGRCTTKVRVAIAVCSGVFGVVLGAHVLAQSPIGQEISIARHLAEGEEFTISVRELVEHGRHLFAANWTSQEGGGRPLTKGTGAPLSDQLAPLV